MPRTSRWAFTPRQLLLCVAAAGLIALGGVIAISSASEAKQAVGWVQHSFRSLLLIDRLRASLMDAESAARGFVLSGDEQILAPYLAALPTMEPTLAQLRAHTRDNPNQQQRIDRLQPLIEARLAQLAHGVDRVRSQGPGPSGDTARREVAKHTAMETRALFDAMRDEENGLLSERLVLRDEEIRQTYFYTLALTLMSLAIFAAAIVSLNRTLRRRMAAERATLEGEERLSVTLRSIGDAVIATDVAGRIVFLNPIAQALTAWREGDAIGAPLDTVFRIVNEYSRETVESPVAKVLREGSIVGLANHTILLARDGSEIPIDDSGAPIRDASGELMGVVLVFRDVTSRRAADQAHGELLRAQSERDAAEAANRARDEFFAVVSHELRSPLAAATGWIEVLESDASTAADRAHAVETIGRNIRLQALLIGDLLDVSRIVAGKLTIERVPLDVSAIVEALVDDYRHAAELRRIDLRFERGASHVALVDRVRFEQVLSNLLSNAMRFTPDGGRIDIALAADGDALVLTVRDTGRGIAPHLLPHIFDRFRQSQDPAAREHGGLGLGLAIAKHLVEQHGGTIAAESDGEGRGATFRIRIPTYDGTGVPSIPKTRSAESAGGVLGGVDVLLVEDHDDTRDALQHLLQSRGATVRVAATAAEAVAQFEARPPTVLISDIGLPRESGIDLIERIRRADAARGLRTPAIAASGFVGGEHQRRALEAGFDAQLPKPLDFATLVEKIVELLARFPTD